MIEEPTKLRVVNDYTVADKENAYQVYRDLTQGGRSLRKTSRLLAIPLQTIHYWSRTLGWQERVWAEDERDAAIIERTARLKMVNELDRMIDELIDIGYHGTNNDKTRLDALKYSLGVLSYSPVQKVQQDITQQVTVRRAERSDDTAVESLSSEKLAELITQKIEALTAGAEGEAVPEGSSTPEDET